MFHLQLYDDGSWGYIEFDRHNVNPDNLGLQKRVVAQQFDEEREAFFARIGERPVNSEYGSNEKLDALVHSSNEKERADLARNGHAVLKLVHDESPYVRNCAVERMG